jgi:ribosomal protein L37AE/L43A
MAVFIRHESCEKCGSSDAKAVYDDGSWHCFSCRATKASDEYLEEVQEQKKSVVKSSVSKIENREMQLAGKELITENEIEVVVENTSVQGKKFRGITDQTYQKYGVRHQFSEKTGDVEEQYYPVTKNNEPAGYKVRVIPKSFYSIGATGKECDLFGQRNFKHGGKNILLSEGELDCMSAYQMLKEYYEGRGMHYDVACVSATTGANSFAQLQNQYKFFDLFENIYVCLDNDKAGEAALEDTIKALPKGKVKIIRMQLKDPNEYLTQGRQKEFVSAYFEAKTYVPDGIIGSGQLYDKMLEYALVEKIPLPPFMKKLDSMLGGIELGTIGIFAAGTGAAKTTVANELLYYWLFHSPHKIGVVSLELTCAQYGQVLLSRHIQQRIGAIKDVEEKNAFLRRDIIKSKAMELFYDTEGNDRFMVIDERDGQLAILQDKIEELVISCGCKVIILDPVSDLMDGLSNDEQALFAKWCKSMIKNYNIAFLMIAHIRKSASNKDAASTGAFIPEEAIMGSSTMMKSASWIVMMQRDKYNADDIIRNTTILTLSKNRSQGETGPAGEIYYDGITHTLHDKETYFIEKQPDNV